MIACVEDRTTSLGIHGIPNVFGIFTAAIDKPLIVVVERGLGEIRLYECIVVKGGLLRRRMNHLFQRVQ